jgi:tetratricopeptide (TPR) repeat protein
VLAWIAAVGMGLAATHSEGSEKVTARRGQIALPTYPWAAVKHPYFRGTDRVNIYPYPMLDFLSRNAETQVYRTVVLENEFLRITFLPELGGKIHEVIDKTTRSPMFYVNHVVKPGLIGQCGAWTSGGVEWNTGPQGHTVSCLQPVPVEILPPEKDGSQSVAIGETERIYGTKWTVVVTLRPGRSFIEERIRIYNPTETIRPYYFWNCTAVPNTPGFRFIYPMTLGCDHAGEAFFRWPIDNGKDLTRGVNYQDASSIFAWHCDQDFFGSYNDDLDHGVVSFANHHQLPGKKAWTWGQGGFGKMHQMDLTDNDGPYNEVQTGPLLTQAQVGRLDPCEAIEWKEWWFPIHGIGGFTFASKELAANASSESGVLKLRLLGTARRDSVKVQVSGNGQPLKAVTCRLSPVEPTVVAVVTGDCRPPYRVEVLDSAQVLASFEVPLVLPKRDPPEKKSSKPERASEFVRAGWDHFLFARFAEAQSSFGDALKKDATDPEANTGLAFLHLDSDPEAAARYARAAVEMAPQSGLARYVLAVAESRAGRDSTALEFAWEAALDPSVAAPARALVGKLLVRQKDYGRAIAALSEPGPWTADPLCRNLLAYAASKRFESSGGTARRKAQDDPDRLLGLDALKEHLQVDPLDWMAVELARKLGDQGRSALDARPEHKWALVDVQASLVDWGDRYGAIWTMPELRATVSESQGTDALDCYWRAYLAGLGNTLTPDNPRYVVAQRWLAMAKSAPDSLNWPARLEMLPAFVAAMETDPRDGKAAWYAGCLQFHLGRFDAGRGFWKRAAELGASPVLVYRALGMASRNLDNDLPAARRWLEKASDSDRKDAIVGRDLARVLFELMDKSATDDERREMLTEARARLRGAFEEGKGRSDFVALLAKANNRLGDYAETAKLLDSVRVTVWEGSREVHDLFEQAHLALGEAKLGANDAAGALAEFNRALEYPANLATGKLENAREAHIQYLRGNALAALGRAGEAKAAWKLAADEPESKDQRQQEARRKAAEALKANPN